MTKPNDRPTIPAPPSAHALNACRAHADALGLPTQFERKRRKAQARLLAQQTEIEARRDTVPAPAFDAETEALLRAARNTQARSDEPELELEWSDASNEAPRLRLLWSAE